MSEAVLIPPVSSKRSFERTREHQTYGWTVAMLFMVSIRVLIFAAGVISVRTARHIVDYNATGIPWIAFDSGFYRYILIYGYPPGPAIPYQIAYFPLYPFAARLLIPLLSPFVSGGTLHAAALLIFSNACSAVGFGFIYAWARSLTNARTAFVTVLLVSTYPGAVFFCAALTEGPFMMFCAIVLYLLRKDRIYWAAGICALATALRPTGVALAAVVVLWALTRSWHLPKARLAGRVFLIGMISYLGACSYEGYLWARYGQYDAYKISEDKWDLNQDTSGSTTNSGLLNLMQMEGDAGAIKPAVSPAGALSNTAAVAPPSPPVFIELPVEPKRYSVAFFIDRLKTTQAWNRLFALTLFTVMIAALLKPTGIPRILLMLPLIIFLMAYIPNAGLRASSIFRYESAGIPLFMVLAVWLSAHHRKPLLVSIMAFSLLVQIYYAFLYSRGLWIG